MNQAGADKSMVDAVAALSAMVVAFYRALAAQKLPASLCEELTAIMFRFTLEKASGSPSGASTMFIPFQTNDRMAG